MDRSDLEYGVEYGGASQDQEPRDQGSQDHLRMSRSARTNRKHYKQLWLMILMLVLVFWLMGKASDPAVFDRFFRSLGVPLKPTATEKVPGK